MHFSRFMPLFVLLLVAPAGAGDSRASGHPGDATELSMAPAACMHPAAQGLPRAGPTAAPRGGRPSSDRIARGVFLVASELLNDPNFSQTVVLLLEYDNSGAMGLVINRPTEVSLASLLPEEDNLEGREARIFIGGPVSRTRLFLLVRSASRPRHSEPVVDGVFASTSLETLHEIIAEESEVAAFQAYAGYAGWGPGQLDAELMRGDWLVSPADSETVFDKATETIWPELIQKSKGLWVYRTPAHVSLPASTRRLQSPGVSRCSLVLTDSVESSDGAFFGYPQIESDRLTTDRAVLDVLRRTP